jgi:translation initiation factor RLI1
MKALDLEPLTGEKEFKTAGKFVTSKPNELGSTLFAGVILGVINPVEGGDFELWDCEITIKPLKKAVLKQKYAGYTYEQIISCGLLNSSAGSTEKPYFVAGE